MILVFLLQRLKLIYLIQALKKVFIGYCIVIVFIINVFFAPLSSFAQNYLLDVVADELQREMKELKSEEIPPYFMSCTVSDVYTIIVSASFGALTYSDESESRLLSVKVRVGDRIVHTAAEGNGPVNALDKALRRALIDVYPKIGNVRLSDYKVRILDSESGTRAQVRVLIDTKNGSDRWSTVGASTNIIEASWHALADSMEYALLNGASNT